MGSPFVNGICKKGGPYNRRETFGVTAQAKKDVEMATRTTEAHVQPLLPQLLEGDVLHAAGMRAGRWVFVTGVNGLFDYATGVSADVVRARLPHWDTSKLRREADQI